MATVYVGGASIDENGKAHGGKAGNQSGRELRKQAWYKHSKGWRVFRAKEAETGVKIADDMRWAIANKYIGYDQWQRNTLYKYAAKVGFNCWKVDVDCETDCSALVRVCLAYAGIDVPAEFRTVNMPHYLLKTGKFKEMTGSKYTNQSAYLREGDILVTATSGHTVVVLNDGDKAEKDTTEPVTEPTKEPEKDKGGETVDITLSVLKKGAKGAEVKAMQTLLKGYGYSLGKWGIDGDFGGDTLTAVKEYQRDNHLSIDGICGKNTWAKMLKG